jgi:hypothetical protein
VRTQLFAYRTGGNGTGLDLSSARLIVTTGRDVDTRRRNAGFSHSLYETIALRRKGQWVRSFSAKWSAMTYCTFRHLLYQLQRSGEFLLFSCILTCRKDGKEGHKAGKDLHDGEGLNKGMKN